MPIPSILNDGFQFGMLGFPTQNLTGMARIRNQHRRIALAPRPFAEGDWVARIFPHSIDDLAHGVPLAGTQVEGAAFAAAGEGLGWKPQHSKLEAIIQNAWN